MPFIYIYIIHLIPVQGNFDTNNTNHLQLAPRFRNRASEGDESRARPCILIIIWQNLEASHICMSAVANARSYLFLHVSI